VLARVRDAPALGALHNPRVPVLLAQGVTRERLLGPCLATMLPAVLTLSRMAPTRPARVIISDIHRDAFK
jgi:hypothetical protein